MKKITQRQQEVLDYIKDFIKDKKYPPAIREVAAYFDISVKGAYDHIKALEKKNMIRCIEGLSRAIEIISQENTVEDSSMRKIPILGAAAAGPVLLSEENIDGYVELSANSFGPGNYFAVNVKGDSMKDAGILSGDVAILKEQNVTENGEIALVNLDDGYTIKRIYKEKNRMRLQPENPAYPVTYTQDARILGKLAYIFRSYER